MNVQRVVAAPLRVSELPFDERAAFALTRLLRSGEEPAAAWPVDLKRRAKVMLPEAIASWVDFVEDRHASWAKVRNNASPSLPIGWTAAAVRLYGGDAILALWEIRVPPWVGPEEAERFLRAENCGLARERKPWERG